MEFQKGDLLKFKYKGGRKVKGKVSSLYGKTMVLLLHTDYLGKNVFWEKGEYKEFNINEMKSVKISPKQESKEQ
jgi:hypothetical protein